MKEYKKLSIKDWALEDRPREKLISKGINSLSDAELIAILIGSGNRNESAVELSKKILLTAGNNLQELGKQGLNELKKNKGIGEAKAISIIAAMEIGRRRKATDIMSKPKITGSSDVAAIFQSVIGDLPYEEFWVLFLNRGNKIMSKSKISQGGIAGTVIDPRIILKQAIDQLASSIILCHNHPSGNNTPSNEDIKVTKKMAEAGKLFDIPVLDHIIIAGDKYYSFADEGMIN